MVLNRYSIGILYYPGNAYTFLLLCNQQTPDNDICSSTSPESQEDRGRRRGRGGGRALRSVLGLIQTPLRTQ